MLDYKFTYLAGTLLFSIVWIIFFITRKDLRKEMITMSLAIGFVGLFYQYFFWLKDWWHPPTITNTRIGIEDFLLGFSNGGIAAVLYEYIFRRTLYKNKYLINRPDAPMVLLIMTLLMIALFWLAKVTSFWATTVALLFLGITLLIFRKDLFLSSFTSGILMALLALLVFITLEYISPGWVAHTWKFQYLSNIKIAGAPIEDLIFYFLVGSTVGPYYECKRGQRLRRLASS